MPLEPLLEETSSSLSAPRLSQNMGFVISFHTGAFLPPLSPAHGSRGGCVALCLLLLVYCVWEEFKHRACQRRSQEPACRPEEWAGSVGRLRLL